MMRIVQVLSRDFEAMREIDPF